MFKIPRTIHQIFGFWDDKIPVRYKRRIERWKQMHPEYKYILWNKKSCRNLIKKKYNYFLSVYDSYQYDVQRVDCIRYFILYEYGGIYSDIDLEPYVSIEPLVQVCDEKNCVLYKSCNSDKITNDFMMSKPRSLFWKKVFKQLILYHDVDYLSKHLTVMFTTGPLFLDEIYNKCSFKDNYIYVIDSKYINNCDVSEIKPARNEEAYLIRHEGNGWHGIDSTIINFVYSYFSNLIIIIIIVTLFSNTPI